MSVYKVAQDVEADDKLIGPFSFRQFIYLIVVAIAMALAWGLAQIFVGFAIIPLPFIIFFGALALPLRKDQPMETYLAAVLAFHLKPKKRIWIPDGVEFLVHISAPKEVDPVRTKDLSQTEAERRLSYLANIVDSEGWAVRGVAGSDANTSMENDVYYTAQQTPDLLDDQGAVAANFDAMMNDTAQRRHNEMLVNFQAAAAARTTMQPPQLQYNIAPAPAPQPDAQEPYQHAPRTLDQSQITQAYTQLDDPTVFAQPPAPAPAPAPTQPNLSYLNDPHAEGMYRETVNKIPHDPSAEKPAENATNTSEMTVNPDIINLVSNSENLSVETLAHEANRINSKKRGDDEVVISLH